MKRLFLMTAGFAACFVGANAQSERSLRAEGATPRCADIALPTALSNGARHAAAQSEDFGDWESLGTATVDYGEGDFFYTGVEKAAPLYVRADQSDPSHLQYRVDGFFFSDISGITAPLYIETVYVEEVGETVAVYPCTLPETSTSQEYGTIMCADAGYIFDMDYYRILNSYTPSPLSIVVYLGTYLEATGTESMFSMGSVSITRNTPQVFTLPQTCVIGADMGMGLLPVSDKADDVWSIRYALVKGDGYKWDPESELGYTTVTEMIVAEDPSLMIMWWMSGDIIASPMEGPGRYTLGAVAYDENDQVLGSATCTVYNMPSEAWNWKPLGEAKVSEDFLREVFAMNLGDAGISADGPAEYTVAVEECYWPEGLYRLVNMYGDTHPYSAVFEYSYDFPVYTYIDHTHEGHPYLLDSPTGFTVRGDASGEIAMGSFVSLYLGEGYDFDTVLAEMPGEFGTAAGNEFRFRPETVALYIPVFKEYFGSDLIQGDMLTANDLVVTMPVSVGVDSVMTESGQEAEYYNLQGVKVDRPQGVCIRVKGCKAEKMIR